MAPPSGCQPAPAPHGKRVLLITHHRRSISSSHEADTWYMKALPTPRARRQSLAKLDHWTWVSQLPCASGLSIGLCLRGLSCLDVVPQARADVAPATLDYCAEEPAGRENGTESVCAFRFLVDHYASRDWDGVYFAHDDVAINRGHRWPFMALLGFLSRNTWPPWPQDGANEESCGCGLVSNEQLRPGYYWYTPMKWCLREGLDHQAGQAPLSGAGFRWPTAFMFAIDSATARRRSLRFYRRMYAVARSGVVMRPAGAQSLRGPWFSPDRLGHVMERLPFLLLGRAFNESRAPSQLGWRPAGRSRPIAQLREGAAPTAARRSGERHRMAMRPRRAGALQNLRVRATHAQ